MLHEPHDDRFGGQWSVTYVTEVCAGTDDLKSPYWTARELPNDADDAGRLIGHERYMGLSEADALAQAMRATARRIKG